MDVSCWMLTLNESIKSTANTSVVSASRKMAKVIPFPVAKAPVAKAPRQTEKLAA